MHLISEQMLQLLHNIILTDNWPLMINFLICLQVEQQQPSFLCHYEVTLLTICHEGAELQLTQEATQNKENVQQF